MGSGLFKNDARRALAAQGLRVVLSLSDQAVDLSGEHVGFAVKLPNYMYTLFR